MAEEDTCLLPDSEEDQTNSIGIEYKNQNFTEGIDDVLYDQLHPSQDTIDDIIIKIEPSENKLKEMSILIVGKTGSGKSTFINSVFGEKVATEKRGVVPQEHDVLERHQRNINGIDITFYDTRGLCDHEVSNKEFVTKLSQYQKIQFDLVLICINITERIDRGMITAINDISNVFDDKFWRHSIILLTFTNRFELELKDDDDDIDENTMANYIHSEVKDVCEIMRKDLNHVAMDVFNKVPFVNIGRIRKGKEKKDRKLSTSDDWVNDVLTCCIRRCSQQTRPSMMKIAAMCVGNTIGVGVIGVPMFGAAGAGVGGVIGGVVGTILFPGIGTVGSAVVGAQWGAGIGIGLIGLTTAVMPYITVVEEYFEKGKLVIKKK